MKLFRKIIFWCHLAIGVIAGIIILVMSVTGALLTYEKQITTWADLRNYQLTVPATPRLPMETLLAKAGAPPTTITLRAEATAPVTFGLTGGRTIFVNPYTGDVLGEGSKGTHDFFRFITDWHRWLGANGENRATAKAVTGACNLGFLFIVVSGFYLWWPRSLTWAQFKNILWFRRGLPGKARDFNWHNVIGFWSLVPLFLVVISGVVISYQWAGNLVYRVAGETPPPRQTPSPAGNNNSQPVAPDGLNQLWSRAEQQLPGWQTISLRMPTSADAPVAFTIDQGTGGQPQKRATLTLDRKTGDVAKWEPFSTLSTGRQLRSLMRFTHTGEVGGIAGQTIAGIVSFGAVVLVWTGLALAWRRLRVWLGKRSRTLAAQPEVTT